MQPSQKLWYSREDKNIAMKKSKCQTLRRSADRKMVYTACFYFQEEYMERTKFEIEQINSKNIAALPNHQEICGSETDDSSSDACK
jgi:molecular chaperone DnaK (HSP70)